MNRVAHQTIIMQYLLELSKTLEASPPQTVSVFFTRYICRTLILHIVQIVYCIVVNLS
jgi:hypothetical protein